jgi:hypothetical protein
VTSAFGGQRSIQLSYGRACQLLDERSLILHCIPSLNPSTELRQYHHRRLSISHLFGCHCAVSVTDRLVEGTPKGTLSSLKCPYVRHAG